MKFNYEIPKLDKDIYRYSIYIVVAILISFLEFTTINLIEIEGIKPDILLIFCVWISLKEGRFKGTIFGFANGLILDFISMTVMGTNAFAKTVASFFSGTFHQEGKEDILLKSINFLVILFITSVIHNTIYYFFYINVIEEEFLDFLTTYGIASSIYTTVLGTIPMLWVNKKFAYIKD